MDKKKLISFIISQLEKDHAAAVEAARATYEAATHEESKPENEYDTRGLEASYLAGAQSKRVTDIEELIYIYKNLDIKNFADKDPIASTALVEVELNNKKSFVFIMPKGGGQILKFENHSIQVITPNSPLGEALLGLKVGATAIVEIGTQVREYDILSIQ